ncbi:hypothetical protein J23TS9_02500 [Paenibacillus sp. J23TS9]|uniref:hypothetical protein n=1 Tax=Paenibacillus sp. J23TS9 TaxID=2807193 RepID=UPI001B182F2F|nr:hypothetical protein [Paenibacillus sp. J23TS9]GIP25120.1 hypothetical protein J23TS9_02500 [Paenibacillus sp. J23TS9]
MWILENFYWILIVGFAVISALSKRGKSKPRQNPRGMPTFGGGSGMERRTHSASTEAPRGRDDVRTPDSEDDRDQPGSASYPQGWSSKVSRHKQRSYDYQGDGPDYDTGEGVSGMWEDNKPETLEDYKNEMEQHLERVSASLDRIEKTATGSPSNHTPRVEHSKPVSPLAKQAINGLIWSEILGPPRSKRPYGGRK